MVVGQNVGLVGEQAVFCGEHETGPLAKGASLTLWRFLFWHPWDTRKLVTKKSLKHIVAERPLFAERRGKACDAGIRGLAFGLNENDRWRDLFCNSRKGLTRRTEAI